MALNPNGPFTKVTDETEYAVVNLDNDVIVCEPTKHKHEAVLLLKYFTDRDLYTNLGIVHRRVVHEPFWLTTNSVMY